MNQHYGSDTWFITCLTIAASSKTFGTVCVPKVFFRIRLGVLFVGARFPERRGAGDHGFWRSRFPGEPGRRIGQATGRTGAGKEHLRPEQLGLRTGSPPDGRVEKPDFWKC